MTWRRSITMVLIAVVLALIAVVSVRQGEHAARAVSGSGPLRQAERFPLDRLEAIELERGENRWRFVREDGAWWQESPFRVPVNERQLSALAERALDLRVEDRLEADRRPGDAALNLDPPNASITFAWPTGSRRFVVGRRGVAGRGYLRVGDGPEVLVVDQGLHELAIDADPTTWREPRLFPGMDIEAQRVTRRVGEEEMTLQREGRDWRFTSPVSTRTNRPAMENYVIDVARAQATGVILDNPPDLEAFGLASPVASLEVTEHSGRTRRLLIGGRVGGRNLDRYVMIEGIPSVLRLDEEALAGLLADPISLFDPVASGVPASSVKAIDLRGPEEDISLRRDVDRWIAVSHQDQEVPADRVDTLLELLTASPASDIALVDPYPHDLEQGTITLIGYDGRPLDTVRVLRETPADGGRWGLENGDRIVRIQPTITGLPLRALDWGLGGP